MEHVAFDVDELVEFWTLLDEDRELLVGKRGASALAFALLLKHYSRHGSFPRRADLSGRIVEFVARQLGVEPGMIEGRSTLHRMEIANQLREVEDEINADSGYLASGVRDKSSWAKTT